MKWLTDFKSGFFYAFYGLRFLFKHASLLRLAFIPWIINSCLFFAAVIALYHYFGALLTMMVAKPEAWYWLIPYYLFSTLLCLLILILITFFVCLLGNLIAAPFHEWIAEKTKKLLYGEIPGEPFSFKQLFGDIKRILSTQFKKVLLILTLEVMALLFLLIPFFGPLISGLLTLFLLSFQFLDFPFGVERLPFSALKAVIFHHPLACLGFGTGISLMLMIPVVSLLVLPGGVVGASLLYYERLRT